VVAHEAIIVMATMKMMMMMMMMVHWDLPIVRKVGKGLGHGVVHGKFKSAGLKLTINM